MANARKPSHDTQAKALAIRLTDDPFGTIAAIEHLPGYFTGSERSHLRINPEDIGETEVGHFAFFHSRYQEKLWPIALQWLRKAELASEVPEQLSKPQGGPQTK